MWLTSGMSRPRAATSEATSKVTSPLRNCSSAAIRAGWSMSPCNACTEKLGRGGDGSRRAGDLDAHWIVQELLGNTPDLRRHGSGEEQGLAGEWNEPADALDVGDEAHVEHAVGLVEDEKFDS